MEAQDSMSLRAAGRGHGSSDSPFDGGDLGVTAQGITSGGKHRRPEWPRRVPGASLPPEAYRAVATARDTCPTFLETGTRYRTDLPTLVRVLGALRATDAVDAA